MLSFLLARYSLFYMGRELLNQHFLVCVFCLSVRSPLFLTSCLQFLCGCFHFFAFPMPSPIPSAFLSLSPFPFPSLLLLSTPSPLPSPFPSCARQWVSTPVPTPVLAPLPLPSPFPSCVPSSAPTPLTPPAPSPYPSRSVPITVYVPEPAPDPVHASDPAPYSDPAPDPARSFPPLGPGYPLGTMRVCRHQALRTELSDARKRHPLSADMMMRVE